MNQNMDNEIWKELHSADWNRISKELLLFTLRELEQYHWKSGSRHLLPAGKMPIDIVQEVIIRTIEGKRQWDPTKGPLVPWLRSQARSLVNALVNSATHRYEELPPEGETQDGEELDPEEIIAGKMAEPELLRSLEPTTLLVETETAQVIQRKINALFEATYEPELLAVLDAIWDGCEPRPRFLAVALGTDITDINNRLKRLRRRAVAILKEERHES